MSSYSDAYADANQSNDRPLSSSSSNFVEHHWKAICFDQLKPKPHDSYLDRSEWTVFFGCLIVLIAYSNLICLSYPMINEIYSKDGYFRRELQLEQNNIQHEKNKFQQMLDDLRRQRNPNDLSCRRCFFLSAHIDLRQIYRILDNHQHVKQEYDECLFPLQSMFVLLCLLNNALIIVIFDQASRLFLLSNAFLLLLFGIYAELFIQDRPSVFYTLVIAVLILLFTMYLLFQVFKTFVIIGHIRRMRNTSQNLQSQDLD